MAELGSDRSSAGAGSVLLISAANHSPPSVSVGLGKLGESDRYSLQLHSIHCTHQFHSLDSSVSLLGLEDSRGFGKGHAWKAVSDSSRLPNVHSCPDDI